MLLLLIVLVVGVLLYLLGPRSEVKETGRITIFCSLFWICYVLSSVARLSKLL